MGYDLHITRKSRWNDDIGPTITPEEWIAVLNSDPELSHASDPDDEPLAGAWKGETLFWFDEGAVSCKNPEESLIRKMVQIAIQLLTANPLKRGCQSCTLKTGS